MSEHEISAPEGRLLNIIGDRMPLEWRKYQQRFGKVWINNEFVEKDFSELAPYLSFRPIKEDACFLAKLKNLIESYHGSFEWGLTAHDRSPLPGNNWTVAPLTMVNLNSEPAVFECEPVFGDLAYDDLDALTAYVISNLD